MDNVITESNNLDQGILLVDKPIGWTSFDCVSFIRSKIAKEKQVKNKAIKVGHSGTLDPFASGLLIILIGSHYTKQASTYLNLNKTYQFSLVFDKQSSTGDNEGQITDHRSLTEYNNKTLSLVDIKTVLRSFIGQTYQTPPAFSAIKVNGQRAYKLARQNLAVQLEPRIISITKLEIVKFNYPNLTLIAEVSSGTYIRVLSEDIAKKLHKIAYTTELRRLAIGECNVDQAKTIEDIKNQSIKSLLFKEIII